MSTRVYSIAFNGIEVINVEVQIKIEPGIPKFMIVGLADKTVAESKERVQAALSSIGLSLPNKKILINLSPADLIKEGSHFDLAIACSVLEATGALPSQISDYIIAGELSLDGSIMPISGMLPIAMGAIGSGKGVICAQSNGSEAAWSGNDDILSPSNLLALINHFKGIQVLAQPKVGDIISSTSYFDMKNIKGQLRAKRALEIAAAGGHHLLMFGPPGSGKSLLASSLPGILPPLTSKEILEVSTIASIAGNLSQGNLTSSRPFRAPHHTCTVASIVGGGSSRRVKPGEISLAHHGVLFLDELPEFAPKVIESLRQPLEMREVWISRSGASIKYPANFQLIAAMNPCKCGYLYDPSKACNKAPICGADYKNKISGPILDRFDLHIEVPQQLDYDYSKILDNTSGNQEEPSSVVASRVLQAREKQTQRFEGYGIATNSGMDNQMIIDYAIPNEDGKSILNEAAKKFKLSMRSYNRVLKVARTIADLSSANQVNKNHILEALNYREMDSVY